MSRVGHGNPICRLRWIAKSLGRARRVPATPGRDPLVIGHRGAPRVAAENTIPSFRAAIEAGADAVETDVCVTRDGQFVLWHDARPSETVAVARQTGREGLAYEPDVPHLASPSRRPVSRLDWNVFRRHYGYTLRRSGPREIAAMADGRPQVSVATIEELFTWVAQEPRLRAVLLDVKLSGRQVPAARELLRRAAEFGARPGGRPVPFFYLSQHVEVLRALLPSAGRSDGAGVSVCGDFERPCALAFAKRLGLSRVSMGNGQRIWRGFRQELSEVVAARQRGRLESVLAWTFNDRKQLEELVAMGVDGILTDDPALLRSLVGRRSGQGDPTRR